MKLSELHDIQEASTLNGSDKTALASALVNQIKIWLLGY
jgi:hypothetical protein